MIDYFALALGHGLLAIAFLRLVMRADLDVDPQIQDYAEKDEAERAAASVAGRNARRNARRLEIGGQQEHGNIGEGKG